MELILSKISHPVRENINPNSETRNPPSEISPPVGKFPNPNSGFRIPKSIKNLIFDFGNVLCNINIEITRQRFKQLGFNVNDPGYPSSRSGRLFEDIETGALSPQQFRDKLRPFFSTPVTDRQIDDAWNALLLDIPEPRIRLLEQLRRDYRIFMLTNTNEIHYLEYLETFRTQYGYDDFDALFEKAYFSYRIGLKKPDPGIFRHVLADSHLNPAETLFIDDTLMHVESANSLGIHGHHLAIGEGEEIMDLFT